jgi:hypothetical protein
MNPGQQIGLRKLPIPINMRNQLINNNLRQPIKILVLEHPHQVRKANSNIILPHNPINQTTHAIIPKKQGPDILIIPAQNLIPRQKIPFLLLL